MSKYEDEDMISWVMGRCTGRYLKKIIPEQRAYWRKLGRYRTRLTSTCYLINSIAYGTYSVLNS